MGFCLSVAGECFCWACAVIFLFRVWLAQLFVVGVSLSAFGVPCWSFAVMYLRDDGREIVLLVVSRGKLFLFRVVSA
jgi:hypothetical protein